MRSRWRSAITSRGCPAPLRRAGASPAAASRNGAWLQATADAVGAPLEVVADAGEAVGPALLALAAVGRPAARAVARTVLPDADSARRFDALYDSYRGLHPLLAGAVAR